MFDYLLQSSHQNDSNMWSNIDFGEEIIQVESNKVYLHTLHVYMYMYLALWVSNELSAPTGVTIKVCTVCYYLLAC